MAAPWGSDVVRREGDLGLPRDQRGGLRGLPRDHPRADAEHPGRRDLVRLGTAVDDPRLERRVDGGPDPGRDREPQRQPPERRAGQGDLPVRRVRQPLVHRRRRGGRIFLALAEVDYFWIANAIYLGFVLWAVVGSVIRLVAYRRGLSPSS